MHTSPVRPAPRGLILGLLLSCHTHERKKKELELETVIMCNQAQETRKGNLSRQIEIYRCE